MKVLKSVTPTPEQMPMILNSQANIMLIRGSAGSGKTTTALLRLKQLVAEWTTRKQRIGSAGPIRILALTFNRTLSSYIQELATSQIDLTANATLEINTFAKWAMGKLNKTEMMSTIDAENSLAKFFTGFTLPRDFLIEEANYIMGRFLPDTYESYITIKRRGRGTSPKITRDDREKILNDIVYPYQRWKEERGLRDWNDLALEMYYTNSDIKYDIVVADECQDFTGNQMRAIVKHCGNPSSVTFILDAAQRIYPRGFTWKGIGVDINPNYIFTLKNNHRNTRQVAQFARAIISDLEIDDDGMLPDFDSCDREGVLPFILIGKFSNQLNWALNYINQNIDLNNESVAFLHPKGGKWFDTVKSALSSKKWEFEDMTRIKDWPNTEANIALCTMHSSKGLEFDHIIILGLNQELTPHGDDEDDTSLNNWRRLLAMAIGRSKNTVIVGYKSAEASTLVQYFSKGTFTKVNV